MSGVLTYRRQDVVNGLGVISQLDIAMRAKNALVAARLKANPAYVKAVEYNRVHDKKVRVPAKTVVAAADVVDINNEAGNLVSAYPYRPDWTKVLGRMAGPGGDRGLAAAYLLTEFLDLVPDVPTS
jgi:hypothetical protein